jgi:hypothetical protein
VAFASPTVEMIVDSDNDEEESEDESFDCILAKMIELQGRFGSSSAASEQILKRLSRITSAKQWTTFLLTQGSGMNLADCSSASTDPGQTT